MMESARVKGWYDERSVENRELLSIAEYDEGLQEKNGSRVRRFPRMIKMSGDLRIEHLAFSYI